MSYGAAYKGRAIQKMLINFKITEKYCCGNFKSQISNLKSTTRSPYDLLAF
jgi:hypothetical protein